MLRDHSCYIYGTWRGKASGDLGHRIEGRGRG